MAGSEDRPEEITQPVPRWRSCRGSDANALVDLTGLPAYLETPNQRTVPLYERLSRTRFGWLCLCQFSSGPALLSRRREASRRCVDP